MPVFLACKSPVSPEEIEKWERFTDPRLLAKHILANFVNARIRRPQTADLLLP